MHSKSVEHLNSIDEWYLDECFLRYAKKPELKKCALKSSAKIGKI